MILPEIYVPSSSRERGTDKMDHNFVRKWRPQIVIGTLMTNHKILGCILHQLGTIGSKSTEVLNFMGAKKNT